MQQTSCQSKWLIKKLRSKLSLHRYVFDMHFLSCELLEADTLVLYTSILVLSQPESYTPIRTQFFFFSNQIILSSSSHCASLSIQNLFWKKRLHGIVKPRTIPVIICHACINFVWRNDHSFMEWRKLLSYCI